MDLNIRFVDIINREVEILKSWKSQPVMETHITIIPMKDRESRQAKSSGSRNKITVIQASVYD